MCEGKRVDEKLSYSPSVLSLVLIMFLFPSLFRRLQHTVDVFVAGCHQSLCFALCFHFSPATKAVAGCTNTTGLFLVLSYALHLICFRVVLASFTFTTMAVGNSSEGFAFVLSPGRFERIKTVLMGTNTPHTCIPGLVWQKQARRFSQFEFKVGELRFPIHFVCVSAALYRAVRGRHFPLR